MANRYAKFTSVGFVSLLMIQSAHMVEHVAQVIQKYGLGIANPHGLLGAIFDFEWVHFLYNTSLEVGLILVLIWCGRATGQPASLALRTVVWLQGYHVVEHVVKMYQYYIIGVTGPTKGILGNVFPVIWVHFWLNLMVLSLVFAAWIAARRMLRQAVSPAFA